MATSSITKNFVVSGSQQVEIFANAVEESANETITPTKVKATKIQDVEALRNFIVQRKNVNAR